MSRIAFLFPGQGSQTVGMASRLVELYPAARERFQEAEQILGYDLLSVCHNGPAERLNATDVSQPAIFVSSIAALEAVKAEDPTALEGCVASAGLSLGEYTALVFAGSIGFADGVRIVQKRGQAMQAAAEATPSSMVSILGLELAEVESMVNKARAAGLIEVANILCPGNTVVSGVLDACNEIEKIAEARGARTIRLAVAGAFHTFLMKPADDRLAEALADVAIQPPRIPVWSNVDAKPHTDPEEIRGLLVRQVVQPVLWEASMRALLADGVDRFYEIGPGRVLAGLLKRVNRKLECRNFTA